MRKIVADFFEGWGVLSFTATLFLVAILCVDWRAWRRKRHRGKCRYCAYTGKLGKVQEHEAKDHVQGRGVLCASMSCITAGNGAG